MPTVESPLLTARIDRTTLLRIYLQYTQDHNTGFNPAWEYLGRSEMQRLWYQFEYFHSRFLKKFGMEVGSKAIQVALSAGMASAIAAPTGPAGVAVSAAAAAVIETTKHSVVAGVKASVSKGHRQWDLHKGRQMSALHRTISPFPTQVTDDEVKPGDRLRAYYYWPGYEQWKMSADDPAHVFKTEIKNKLYFKPPKSGERLNHNAFSYESMLIPDNPEEQKKFTVIWDTTKFWPMLDYLFFNQSFYTKFQNFKDGIAPEFYKDFLLATRFYFLSRDFYVDHFFNQVLPKYEMILSRYKGVFVGSDILSDFFGVLHQKIDQISYLEGQRGTAPGVAAPTDPRLKIKITHSVSLDMIKSCQSLFSHLPTEMQVSFQHFMRSLFLESSFKMSAQGPAHDEKISALQEGFISDLKNNEDYYDRITDLPLLEKEKKFILRTIAQTRRHLFRKGFSGKSLLKQASKLEGFKLVAKESLARKTHPLADLLSKAPSLHKIINPSEKMKLRVSADFRTRPLAPPIDIPEVPDEEIIGTDMVIEGGLAVADALIEVLVITGINEFLKANKKIPPRVLKNLEHIGQIYGGIRVIGGTANFICKGITGDSLLALIGDSKAAVIGSHVAGGVLFGPNAINILAGVALQYGRNLLYTKMDQDCLTVVDKLVSIASDQADTPSSLSMSSVISASPVLVKSSAGISIDPLATETSIQEPFNYGPIQTNGARAAVLSATRVADTKLGIGTPNADDVRSAIAALSETAQISLEAGGIASSIASHLVALAASGSRTTAHQTLIAQITKGAGRAAREALDKSMSANRAAKNAVEGHIPVFLDTVQFRKVSQEVFLAAADALQAVYYTTTAIIHASLIVGDPHLKDFAREKRVALDQLDAAVVKFTDAFNLAFNRIELMIPAPAPAPALVPAFESIFNSSFFKATESLADAQTYLNASPNFQKSTLILGGIRQKEELKIAYGLHRMFTVRAHSGEVPASSLVLPDIFNEFRTASPPLLSFRNQHGELQVTPSVARLNLPLTIFFGAENLQGCRLIEYAVNAVKVFTSIENQWVTNGLTSGFNFHQYVERLRRTCFGIDNIQRLAFGIEGSGTGVVPQDSNTCIAMAEAWSRAAEVAFLLLQLEKGIDDHLKIKSKKKDDMHSKAFEVYKKFASFINGIIVDKATLPELLLETNSGNLHAAHPFVRAQMIFMRSLYLTGMHLYNKWMYDVFRLHPAQLHPIIAPSEVPIIVLFIRDEYSRLLQVSNMSYDAPDFAQNAHRMVRELPETLERHYHPAPQPSGIEVPVRVKEWHDFSDLKLGLKFDKDPASFTYAEKQMLYKDFGRVVRHLFNSAPTPKELSELKEKLKIEIENLKSADVVLAKSHIETYMKLYLEYLQGVCKTENFLYYARVYQFVQETVRIDFLKSTEVLRTLILSADSDQEIKILCEQLQLEQDLFSPNISIQKRLCIMCKKHVDVTQIFYRKPDGTMIEGPGVCPSGHKVLRGG